MEAESPTPVARPDRLPDHVTHYGSAFWWNEMVYMGGDGSLGSMKIDEDTGKLMLHYNGGRVRELSPDVVQKRNEWWYQTFERHVIGDDSD
jgi:hypothetical protein